MDAITMLREDHRTVKQLFKQFEKAQDPREQRTIADQIVRELSIHAAIEEQVFYPGIRQAAPELEKTILEALEEHHVAKWTLSEIESMQPDEERFEAKVTVLIESVRHHVEEEEGELFPEVRKALGRKELAAMGEAMQKLKKTAPTRPHPRQPDTPPGNAPVGLAAGLVDRARDAVGRKDGAKTGTAKKPASRRTTEKVGTSR